MIYTLIMNFRTSRGRIFTLSIDGVEPLITDKEVNDLMDNIISLNLFYTPSKGILQSKVSSNLVLTSSTAFEMY